MKLKLSAYPNNEIRATFYHERGSKIESADGEDGLGSRDDVCGYHSSVTLDITSKLDPGTERPGFGGMPRSTRFGNKARRTLSRAAGVLEKDGVPPSECLFLTGTIPGSTLDAFDAVACWSSWVLHEVKKWINRQGVIGNLSMYVWEFQSRGALHLHYFVHVPDEAARARVLWKWAIKWAALINEVGVRFGCDIWEKADGTSWSHFHGVIQAPAQYVRKSVGAYLSKYLSKNAPTNGQKGDRGDAFLGPVRWWGVSRPLLQRLDELTDSFEVDGLTESTFRRVAATVEESMSRSEGQVHSYWDKGFNAKTILTFSPGLCNDIYQELWRDLYAPKLAQLARFRGLAAERVRASSVRVLGATPARVCHEADLGQLKKYLSDAFGIGVTDGASGVAVPSNSAKIGRAPELVAARSGVRLTSDSFPLQLQLVAI